MRKLIACLAVCLLASVNAFADTSYGNQRLDHALYPLHPPKLVVAGEIKVIKGKQYTHDRELSFEVERVILGDRALAHTIITVPTPGFDYVARICSSFFWEGVGRDACVAWSPNLLTGSLCS